jgi:SUMO ligase MMS21 Smc5/6 complex component
MFEKRNELLKEIMEYNRRGEELLNKMKEITLVDNMVERKDIIDVLPYLTRDEVFSVYDFIQNMLFPPKEENDDIGEKCQYCPYTIYNSFLYKIFYPRFGHAPFHYG